MTIALLASSSALLESSSHPGIYSLLHPGHSKRPQLALRCDRHSLLASSRVHKESVCSYSFSVALLWNVTAALEV